MDVNVAMKKLRPSARTPRYATPGAGAMDLHACLDSAVTIPSGGLAAVPTGIAISLPSRDYVALIFSRSGHGFKHGISLVNGVGVIDSDYRGEIAVGLRNQGAEPFVVNDGDRIAQMAVLPVCHVTVNLVDNLPPSLRGSGGFGSTGTC